MSKPDDWYPHYIADYAADTMHLTTVQHGAYRLLMDAYWRNQGPLEGDDEALAAITRLPLKEWRKMRPTIARFFQIDGAWSHKRIEKELTKARQISEQKANAGRASAEAKRQRRVNGGSTPVSTALPTAEQRDGDGAATGTSTAGQPLIPHTSQAAPSGAAGDAALARRSAKVSEDLKAIFGTDENRTPGWAVLAEISGWLMAGADPDLDILPTARSMAQRFAGKRPPGSPSYLTNAVMEALAKRRGIVSAAPALVPIDSEREAAAQRLNVAMDGWIARGREGPMPKLEDFLRDPLEIPEFMRRKSA